MSVAPSRAAALAIENMGALKRADPLEHFRCSVWAAEELYRAMSLDPPPEVYWHAANNGGKTHNDSALDVAFLTGRDHLVSWNGERIPVPVIRPPVVGILVVPSYKLASGSTLAALRGLIGSWPHHEGVISSAQDAVAILYVKHRLDRGEHFISWSRLYVFPHDGEMPEGLRADFARADEPPPQRMWDAVRNRGKRGRPYYRRITATPIERRFWQWIRDDFPREHKKIEGGKLRLQSSLYDNRSLTPADFRRAEQANATSPWKRARLYGDHVDISGTCPFDGDALGDLLRQATEGAPHVALETTRDGRATLKLKTHTSGRLMVWSQPAQVDRVLVLADPSSGVKDPDKSDAQQTRNPAGLMAVSLVRRAMLARYNGYVTPPELGLMARALCNEYRNWIFVPEMNGGWGEECLRSFLSAECASSSSGMIYQDVDPTSTIGNAAARVGWWQSTNRIGATVAALQRALLERSLAIPSRAAIENLMAVRLDDRERAVQGTGHGAHGEDMRLLGMACSIMENPQLIPVGAPKPDESEMERFEHSLRLRIPGRDEYDGYAPERSKWR